MVLFLTHCVNLASTYFCFSIFHQAREYFNLFSSIYCIDVKLEIFNFPLPCLVGKIVYFLHLYLDGRYEIYLILFVCIYSLMILQIQFFFYSSLCWKFKYYVRINVFYIILKFYFSIIFLKIIIQLTLIVLHVIYELPFIGTRR